MVSRLFVRGQRPISMATGESPLAYASICTGNSHRNREADATG
jgi:hypothetical protein